MSYRMDEYDIQGNILSPYSRAPFPRARYLLFCIEDVQEGRLFLRHLMEYVTSGGPWAAGSVRSRRPEVTTNLALSYGGLRALGVPEASLLTFPEEFVMGMEARKDILGDDGPSSPEHWDPVWRQRDKIHLLVMINGPAAPAQGRDPLQVHYDEVVSLLRKLPRRKVSLLSGHRAPEGQELLPYQAASALFEDGKPSPKEHFGYVDGLSNPVFRGDGSHPDNVIGGGKVVSPHQYSPKRSWERLEPGEFLLGHKDEAAELPIAPKPALLGNNGTFLVFRKLHQNVASFRRFLSAMGDKFPGGPEALAAKFAGRWRNGAPLTTFPTEAEANALAEQWNQARVDMEESTTPEARKAAKVRFGEFQRQMIGFDYSQDLEGGACPLGAHTRRVNPRGALEFGQLGAFETPSALTNRRRILRRGLPYGLSGPETADSDEHGIIFMVINASIKRQFEFVQQQWINYGNDFRLANEKDALLGNHGVDDQQRPTGEMSIPANSRSSSAPFFCGGIPRLVETRGGEYFFVPSMTALRMLVEGTIDPT